jgi:putative transcriptional regulator
MPTRKRILCSERRVLIPDFQLELHQRNFGYLRSRATFAFCLLLVLGRTSAGAAQEKPNKDASEDKPLFLVARPEIRDPIFKESVVLMLPAGKGPVVGLIVNRPARVALSAIFPDDQALKDRSETAYFGGPVDPRAPSVVFRSTNKAAKQATLLFGDVYLSFDRDFIKELLKKPGKTPDLRLFVGRSLWAPAQLQNELASGAWHSVRAETNMIFSTSPQYLWHDLYERSEHVPVAKISDAPFNLSANRTELSAH